MRLDDPMNKTKLLVERIRVSVDASDEMIANNAKEKMKRAGLNTSTLHFRLYKRSVDARKKNDVHYVYTVDAIIEGLNAKVRKLSVCGPLGDKAEAYYGISYELKNECLGNFYKNIPLCFFETL